MDFNGGNGLAKEFAKARENLKPPASSRRHFRMCGYNLVGAVKLVYRTWINPTNRNVL
jgi:hypothetical protein